MKAALAVHRVVADQAANLNRITKLAREAANKGAGLVVFSETALTGSSDCATSNRTGCCSPSRAATTPRWPTRRSGTARNAWSMRVGPHGLESVPRW
ncbi:hypothetical protein F4554_001308 [Actinopolymorpha rutila]|uniref:CN hydrolase domain-containing protein n=1 Tax=Actinopolymorpha rutila TaxID=446787 RepID=A0A852ZHW0_9ACTN|nr:hypothetical protein [Actinopolymorpha rutila]